MNRRRPSVRSVFQASALLLLVPVLLSNVTGCGKSDSGAGSATSGDTSTTTPGGSTTNGSSPVVEPGYAALFNGQNLNGWHFNNNPLTGQTATPDLRFQTRDGNLVILPRDKDGKSPSKDLVLSQTSTKNFILKLQFKAGEESLNYVMIRNYPVPIGDYVRRGIQQLRYFKADGWNDLEVVVKQLTRAGGRVLTQGDSLEASYQGGKATATLNGKSIDPNSILVRLEGSQQCNNEGLIGGNFHVPTTGSIGLRAFTGRVEIRNIRIQTLPD